MHLSRFLKADWLLLAGVSLVLAALVIPPGVSVWDGHIPLTVEIDAAESIDRGSLLFASCWFETEAEQAASHPGQYDYGFHPPKWTGEGDALIDIPVSGRTKSWITGGTNNHPQHLVVQFRLLNVDGDQSRRKRFAIPSGRGPRSLAITLP